MHHIDPIAQPPITPHDTIYLAGGCFWGVQAYFDRAPGILYSDVGYANGTTPDPTYETVCAGQGGFAEAVRLCYDPHIAPLPRILAGLFAIIDPTSVNRQGYDVGVQYRSGIYYTTDAQRAVAETFLASRQQDHARPLAVACQPLQNYYLAEPMHQQYLAKNPGGYCHIPAARYRDLRQNGLPYAQAPTSLEATQYAKATDTALAEQLSTLSYAVTRQNATEPPGTSPFTTNTAQGIYVDITTGEPLFRSHDQFDAGCGWPSFTQPIDPAVVTRHDDHSHYMLRTEVRSRVGDSHLGHVFPDGPADRGGQRYCINGAALRFIPKDAMEKEGYDDLLDLL